MREALRRMQCFICKAWGYGTGLSLICDKCVEEEKARILIEF